MVNYQTKKKYRKNLLNPLLHIAYSFVSVSVQSDLILFVHIKARIFLDELHRL